MSKPALAATAAACALAVLALSYNQAPALSRGVTARSANNLRTVAANQLKGVNPATLAKVTQPSVCHCLSISLTCSVVLITTIDIFQFLIQPRLARL